MERDVGRNTSALKATHLYLIEHPPSGALKVGVSRKIESRLADHALHGWKRVMVWYLGPDAAFRAEREMLDWLKSQGEHPPTDFHMPQGGISEVWLGSKVSKETAVVRIASMYEGGRGGAAPAGEDPLKRHPNPDTYYKDLFEPEISPIVRVGRILGALAVGIWIYNVIWENYLGAALIALAIMSFATWLFSYPLNPAYYKHEKHEQRLENETARSSAAWEHAEDLRIEQEQSRIAAEKADREWARDHYPDADQHAWNQLASKLGLGVKTVRQAYRNSTEIRQLLDPEFDEISLSLIRRQKRVES